MAGALIGALRVSLSAETSAFEAGMRRSQRTAQKTATGIGGAFKGLKGIFSSFAAGFLGALSVGAIVAAGKAALDYAGSLAEVGQQLGVTTKDLQVFRFAAGQLGVSQEQLETGLSKLTITLGKVAAGAKTPAAALKAIGISAAELRGKDTGEAFRIIADGLQKVTDRSQRAAVEVALFGKSGAMLDNLLAGGSGRVNELADAAERLGIVLSDEQIQRADDTADKLEALQTVLKAQLAGIVADNAGAILDLADAFGGLARAISDALFALRNFRAQASSRLLTLRGDFEGAASARGSAFVSDRNETIPGRSVTISLPPIAGPARSAGGGQDIGRFLGRRGRQEAGNRRRRAQAGGSASQRERFHPGAASRRAGHSTGSAPDRVGLQRAGIDRNPDTRP